VSRSVRGDREAAEAAREALLVELGMDKGPKTMARLLNEYYERTKSRREKRSNIDNHLIPTLGMWRVEDVTTEMIETWYMRYQERTGLADGTMHHLFYIVRPALKQAVRYGWIPMNPAAFVDEMKLDRKEYPPPTFVQVLEVIAELVRKEYADTALMASLGAVTAARPSEVAGLQWRNIDLLNRSVYIEQVISEPKEGREVKTTKTKKSKRWVPIDDSSVEVLAMMLDDLERFGVATADQYVFAEGDGLPKLNMHEGRFRRAVVACGHSFRMYDLRSLAASTWLRDKVRLIDVSALLGHARTSTTQNYYEKLLERPEPQSAAIIAGHLAEARRQLAERDGRHLASRDVE
jgi:integrase